MPTTVPGPRNSSDAEERTKDEITLSEVERIRLRRLILSWVCSAARRFSPSEPAVLWTLITRPDRNLGEHKNPGASSPTGLE